MKRRFVFSLTLCFFLLGTIFKLNGQGLKNLDSQYGIGTFKLGSAFSVFSKNLKYFDTDKLGVEFYIYNKPESSYFGKPVKKITLGFYEGKLYTVSVFFGILEKRENLAVLDKMKDLYDIPEVKYINNSERVWVAVWETGKVFLQANEYSCESQIYQCETEVFIYSKSIKRSIYK